MDCHLREDKTQHSFDRLPGGTYEPRIYNIFLYKVYSRTVIMHLVKHIPKTDPYANVYISTYSSVVVLASQIITIKTIAVYFFLKDSLVVL